MDSEEEQEEPVDLLEMASFYLSAMDFSYALEMPSVTTEPLLSSYTSEELKSESYSLAENFVAALKTFSKSMALPEMNPQVTLEANSSAALTDHEPEIKKTKKSSRHRRANKKSADIINSFIANGRIVNCKASAN